MKLYPKFLSSQLVCKKRGSHGALQQDPGLGGGGPAPMSISQDRIKMHIWKLGL